MDKVFVWPDGSWYRFSEGDSVDALEEAIHDRGFDYGVFNVPEDLPDEEVDTYVDEKGRGVNVG